MQYQSIKTSESLIKSLAEKKLVVFRIGFSLQLS
jgi:hypothetical protein